MRLNGSKKLEDETTKSCVPKPIKEAKIHKNLLEGSKVNQALARELINSKP